MSYPDKKIEQLIHEAIQQRVFPGAVVGYIVGDEKTILPFGHLTYEAGSPVVTKETVYDVASLTKVIPTNSIILSLVESGKLSLDDRAIKYIPELKNDKSQEVLIRHLLTYTAVFDFPRDITTYAPRGAQSVLDAIYTLPLKYPPGEGYLYADAPIILLGLIAERILSKPLDQIADEMFFRPLNMSRTTFHPDIFPKKMIAPTEVNERGEVHGEVHDETAFALRDADIISGHAGIFSVASDLLIFAEMLLAKGQHKGIHYFKPETIHKMHTNQLQKLGASAGLGWNVGRPEFMGDEASKECFGKTGFTGTMILVDPTKQKALVILSNRTYPKRPATPDAMHHIRRQVADVIFSDKLDTKY